MNERYIKWYTPWLSRELEMLAFRNPDAVPLLNHWFDDGKWHGHEWNYRQDMLPYYLSLL